MWAIFQLQQNLKLASGQIRPPPWKAAARVVPRSAQARTATQRRGEQLAELSQDQVGVDGTSEAGSLIGSWRW